MYFVCLCWLWYKNNLIFPRDPEHLTFQTLHLLNFSRYLLSYNQQSWRFHCILQEINFWIAFLTNVSISQQLEDRSLSINVTKCVVQKYIYELSAEPRLLDVAGLMLEYQYAVSRRRRVVVNLSRRQTLIKIFTKYLPGANSNIQHTTPTWPHQQHWGD